PSTAGGRPGVRCLSCVHPIPEEEIQMSRIARTVSTIAVVVSTGGLIQPAAQAKADGLYPHVVVTTSSQPGTGNLQNDVFVVPIARGDRGAWDHDTPLADHVDTQTTAVAGRGISHHGRRS